MMGKRNWGSYIILWGLTFSLLFSCGEDISSHNQQSGTGLGANGSSFQGSDFNMAQVFALKDTTIDQFEIEALFCQSSQADIFQKIDNRLSPALGQTLCGRTLEVGSHQNTVGQTYAAIELLLQGSFILYPTQPRRSESIENLKHICRFTYTEQLKRYFIDYIFYNEQATLIINQFNLEGSGPRGPLDSQPQDPSDEGSSSTDEGPQVPSKTLSSGSGIGIERSSAGSYTYDRTDEWVYSHSEVIEAIPYSTFIEENKKVFRSPHEDFSFQILLTGEKTVRQSLEAFGSIHFNPQSFNSIDLEVENLEDLNGECWHE